MAESYSYEEALGVPPARKSSTPESFPRVSVAEQRTRDAEATRIKEGEQTGFPGFVKTSDVISPRSPRAAEETLSYEDAMGAESGFTAGAKGTFGELSMQNPTYGFASRSIVKSLYDAYMKGAFDKPLGDILGLKRDTKPATEEELEEASRPAFGTRTRGGQIQFADKKPVPAAKTPESDGVFQKMLEGIKADPGRFLGGVAKELWQAPEMLFAPAGLGGRLATAAAQAGRGGAAVGRGVEGAASGALFTAPTVASQQLAEEGQLNLEELGATTMLGVGMGGAVNAALGRAGRARPETPRPPEGLPPRLTDQRPRSERSPEGLPPPAKGMVDDAIEGEWTRVSEEVRDISSKPPEARAPQETARLLSFNKEWAQANALPVATGAALAAYTLFGDDPEKGILGIGLLGAMKAKGGMWHPKAAETLSTPITERLSQVMLRPEISALPLDAQHTLIMAIKEWPQKVSQTYLNKHMGTATDPLREIEIPFGEGTKKWGEISDTLVSGQVYEGQRGWPSGARPGETMWNIDQGYQTSADVGNFGEREMSAKALKSYLSHVGDYLRQNVPPEKLGQYDLVRAVRETAQNDVRVAKEMEKAAAAETKDLPVHKDYGDGFKWIELKKPETLTPEQRKGIVEDEGTFYAVDAQGKRIENTYTGMPAQAATPEEAFLAGQLAREGNQMGHCVGGYCEGVASGESRIFSLRDAKGKSHVTVEAGGNPFLSGDRLIAAGRDDLWEAYKKSGEPDLHKFVAENDLPLFKQLVEGKEDILQIKGKQNRAPTADYLPYVQDFVKSGKWGEVGDLENTGLERLSSRFPSGLKSQEFQTFIEGRLGKDDLYPKEQVDAAWDDWLKGARERNQFGRGEAGSIDPKLLTGIAALGLGGLLGAAVSDDEDEGGKPVRNAILGALGAAALSLPAGRAAARAGLKTLEQGLGLVSTRVRNISPRVHHSMIEYERRVFERTFHELERVVPFMKELKGLRGKLDAAILTNDPARVRAGMKAAGIEPEWNAVRATLNRLGKELNQHGRFKSMLDDYFPRVVKDVDGLLKALGKERAGKIQDALAEAEKASLRKRGVPLSNIEQSVIINRLVFGPERISGQPGFAKRRSIQEVTEELKSFYHKPAEGLFRYVNDAVQDLEKMRLFGKNAVQTDAGGKKYLNLEASIGNLLGEELRAGRIDKAGMTELEGLLRSRYGPAERAMPSWQQDFRNITNAALLGNPGSAAVQLGDTIVSLYHQGMPAFVGLARAVGPNKPITAKELGLIGHIAQEFDGSPRATAKLLDWSFKWSGFAGVDRFGKNVLLNSALARAQRLAKTPAGVKVLGRKYSEAFGADFPQLVADLKAGRKSDLVKSYAFHELSDAQPITKLETTQAHMDTPAARLAWQLKSFAIKQLDIAYRDGIMEIKRGNRVRGVGNLAKLSVTLGLAGMSANAVKDFLMGNEIDLSVGSFAENLFKIYLLSEYTRNKMEQGKPIEAVVGLAIPPYKILDEILRADPKAVSYLGPLGKLYYSHLMGGKEKEAERREKAARRREREE